jgi:phosphatidylserine/phosphatidylglycerophosphate/cardiolipin synthase-like enzyme
MKTLIKEETIINGGSIPFPILSNGGGWKSTEKDDLSVLESGGEKVLLSRMIKAVNEAQERVCLQSFLIQDTALVQALVDAVEQRGVRVYILSSAEARLKETIEEELDFIKSDYIQMLEVKFRNHFIHRSAENFHGKYIVIDPRKNAKGFICTNNFTENGFARNPELAVELTPEQCEELFMVFVYHFWEHSTDEQTAAKEFDKVRPANRFVLPDMKEILLTSPNTKFCSLNSSLVKAVSNAKESISLSTFMLDKDTELVKKISDKARQGIEVFLFCRPMERLFNDHLKSLLEVGVRIVFHPLIHAKSLLVDNKHGYVFTANLVAKGLDIGLEVGVKLSEQQAAHLALIHRRWKDDFPWRAVREVSMQDLEEVEIFKEGKLTRVILSSELKEERQKVNIVGDLISFFGKKRELRNRLSKSLKVKLVAEINELPQSIKVTGKGRFEVIQVEEAKGKRKTVVLLRKDFTVQDLPQLMDYTDCRVYCE